ncbi:MAG: 4-hydroxy-tetrahydrodipicolinate reductase [Nitrososphaerota archaeon]
MKIKICVAGATGRMGSTLIKEAINEDFEIVGAVSSSKNPNIGKTLREIGLCDSNVKLLSPENLEEAVKNADVYVSFTNPEAEMLNIPIVANLNKKIVVGTTGFTEEQFKEIKNKIANKVPAIFSPNFSIGVNILYKIISNIALFPKGYDVSIIEIHHTGKKDAPSGTAKKICKIISDIKGYDKIIYGREGYSPRKNGEIEISSLRVGGIPGIHDIIIAGQYEMIKIEHTAFSRNVFAQGALYAVKWIYNQSIPGIYTMEDVLKY